MELLEDSSREEIIVEIEEFLKTGDGRSFGDLLVIPKKCLGALVIQGMLAEIMKGRYPYWTLQIQYEMFQQIARALRDRDPYPLLGLEAELSSEEKVLETLAKYAIHRPPDVSPAKRVVQDLGILERHGARCLVEISYRCAIDISSVNFEEYFYAGKGNRMRNLFHLSPKGRVPRCTLTVGQLLQAAKIGKLETG